jgi:hypothetical protein
MLVLEGYESMADKMRQIEQERIVLSILIVQHYSAIVYKFYFFWECWKAVLLTMNLWRLFDQSCPLLLLLLMLFYQSSSCIVNDFQSIKVIA